MTRASPNVGRGGVYLLTWTTYGSWLPGHAQGFVSAVDDGAGGLVVHNAVGSPFDADMPELTRLASSRMRTPAVVLSASHAGVVGDACTEVCERHNLRLIAGAAMATHVHLVVESPALEGPRLLNLFKGVASRRLGQRFGTRPTSWWTSHGSRRLLPTARSQDAAVDYVLKQDRPLALFGCAKRTG